MLNKGFRAPPAVSFVGAVFYMMNPEFVSHVYPGHDGKMFVIAWLPFVVWRLKALLEKPNALNVTLLSLGVAMSLYTSHIQMTYFMLIGLFLYWVFFLVITWLRERNARSLVAPGVAFWIAIFIGIGAAFIQFYPSFMFVRDAFSVRGLDRGFEYAASWSLHWPEFFSMWVPEFGNFLEYYWSENPFKLNTEYAGAMATLFAVVAVAFQPRNARRWFWAGVAIFALLFSMGAHTPVFHLAYHLVPGIRKMRGASMMMLWFSFAVSLLSGLFLRDLFDGKESDGDQAKMQKRNKRLLITMAVITGVTLLFSLKGFVAGLMSSLVPSLGDPRKAQIFDANFSKNFVPYLWLWWVFSIAALGMLWGVLNRKLGALPFLSVIVIVAVIDTVRVNQRFIQVQDHRRYFHTEESLQALQETMGEDPFRVFLLPGTFNQSNAAGIHRLEGVTGFHDNELRWYREFRGDQSSRNYLQGLISAGSDGRQYLVPENMRKGNGFLNLANVRYIITRTPRGLHTERNQGALGRLSFAPNYIVMPEEKLQRAIAEGSYDIRSTVALLEEPAEKPAPADSVREAEATVAVEWHKYSPNYRRAEIESPGQGFLRISEVWYPGWSVLVDGKKVPVYRADLAWMAIPISGGNHVIEMMPDSLYYDRAMWVTLPLIVLLIGIWGWAGFAAWRRKKGAASGS
jgi:hypothetical protein